MHKLVVLALVAALSVSASGPAAPPKAPAPVAPNAIPHPVALFLGSLCNEGARPVTFKARARGVRFFFEEPSGVTVYRFLNGSYVKEEFLGGFTLDRAVKKYATK